MVADERITLFMIALFTKAFETPFLIFSTILLQSHSFPLESRCGGMVDARDSKSRFFGSAGSSPAAGTGRDRDLALMLDLTPLLLFTAPSRKI